MILDAGGCAGNICGFDEPRWFDSRSAIFSAGLRDMDAILGRDDRLVEKVVSATEKIGGGHVAVIGTPVPAVIATDYRAIGRMIRKKTGLPAVTVETDGTRLYDRGASLAWKKLFKTFTDKTLSAPETDRIGVLGASPLEFGGNPVKREELSTSLEKLFSWMEMPADPARIKTGRPDRTWLLYGFGHGIPLIKEAGRNACNIVLSPAGLGAARELEKSFGTPWIMTCPPDLVEEWKKWAEKEENFQSLCHKKILIVHQQALANTLRCQVLSQVEADVTVGSWFMMDRDDMEAGDLRVREEGDWIRHISSSAYDVIIADPLFRRAVPAYTGRWIDLPHFAVSGKGRERDDRGQD